MPTNKTFIEIFEKTKTRGFSSGNSKLECKANFLTPNYDAARYNKLNFDENFKSYKREDFKVIYKPRLDGEDNYPNRRVIFEALKRDKNNQCKYAIRKPEATGCINKKQYLPGENLNIYCRNCRLMTK